jgi:hypothetical protein
MSVCKDWTQARQVIDNQTHPIIDFFMQYVVDIAPVSNIDAIRKYYCIGLMVINSDAICDFITSVQD